MTNKVTIEEAKEIQLSEIAELKKEVSNLKLLNGHWKEKWESRSREVVKLKIIIKNTKRKLKVFANSMDKIKTEKPNLDILNIQEEVCAYFSLRLDRLVGKQKNKGLVTARQIAMYLCRQQNFSYPDIGKAFGNRDHTTVMHAVKRVESSEELKLIAEEVGK